ncbi:MAG: hypothetical protein ACKOBM_12725 [Gammaproteobacteria bacterium]
MTRLPWRIAGVVLLVAAMGLWQPDSATVAARLGVPLLMALAAALIVQNLAAVALGAAILAGIHSDPGAADLVTGIGYPLVASVATMLLLFIFWQRFRARIRATHDARWQHRRRVPDESNP